MSYIFVANSNFIPAAWQMFIIVYFSNIFIESNTLWTKVTHHYLYSFSIQMYQRLLKNKFSSMNSIFFDSGGHGSHMWVTRSIKIQYRIIGTSKTFVTSKLHIRGFSYPTHKLPWILANNLQYYTREPLAVRKCFYTNNFSQRTTNYWSLNFPTNFPHLDNSFQAKIIFFSEWLFKV